MFITSHAHDVTGDLYGGPEFSADPYEVNCISYTFLDILTLVSRFSRLSCRPVFTSLSSGGKYILISLFAAVLQKQMVCEWHFSRVLASTSPYYLYIYIWFLCCNIRVHAEEAIAFSSPGLIPTLTNPFWLDFTIRVLVEGFTLIQALPYMLACTSTLSFVRHTNLLHVQISPSKNNIALASEYIWTHPSLRPFGRRLLANCIQCGCLDSYGAPIKVTPKSGTTYVFVCKGLGGAGHSCSHELVVKPMEGFIPYGKPQDGARWMVRAADTFIL